MSKADTIWEVLKASGPSALADIGLALVAEGFNYSPEEIRRRVNSLHRRKRIIDTGRRRKGLNGRDAWIWAIDPDADLRGPGDDAPAPDRLHITLKHGNVDIRIYRPRRADGAMRPSALGLRLGVACLPDLVTELRRAEGEARRLGLIGGGE